MCVCERGLPHVKDHSRSIRMGVGVCDGFLHTAAQQDVQTVFIGDLAEMRPDCRWSRAHSVSLVYNVCAVFGEFDAASVMVAAFRIWCPGPKWIYFKLCLNAIRMGRRLGCAPDGATLWTTGWIVVTKIPVGVQCGWRVGGLCCKRANGQRIFDGKHRATFERSTEPNRFGI